SGRHYNPRQRAAMFARLRAASRLPPHARFRPPTSRGDRAAEAMGAAYLAPALVPPLLFAGALVTRKVSRVSPMAIFRASKRLYPELRGLRPLVAGETRARKMLSIVREGPTVPSAA